MNPTDPPGESSPPAAGPSLVPSWVRGHTNLFATLAAAVVAGIGLFLIGWMAPVLAPLGLGLFLAALAAPMFNWLERRGGSMGLALTLTVLAVVAIGAGLVALAVFGARTLADGLASYSAALETRFPDAGETLATAGVMAAVRDVLPPGAMADILRVVTGVVLEIGEALVFAIIIAALLLLDSRRLASLTAGGLGSQNPVFREAPAIARSAVTYFTVRIRVNAVTAVLMLILMLVVGVDNALLWAVGAFFLSFVPYLGLVLAMIPPVILALAESGPVAATVVAVGAIVLNVLAENVLEPTLTGRALSLSTWLVFAMFFFWVWLIGPLGALLSMPITVLIVLVLQHNEPTRWLAALLAHEHEPAPDRVAIPRPIASPDRADAPRE